MTRDLNPARRSLFRTPRAAGAALVALFMVVLVAVALPGTARAESFQYWSLWESTGSAWQPAQTGAGEIKLDDGSAFAAKYVETEAELKDRDAPQSPASFAELCADAAPAGDGEARIAVVVDFGDPALAPEGQAPPETKVSCVSVSAPATAADALNAAAEVGSDEGGFIATIDGYPGSAATPEAVTTDETTDAGTTAAEDDGINLINWLVALVPVLVIVLLIIWVVRRNRARKSEEPAEQ